MGIIPKRKRKINLHRGRERKKRPKTFKSMEKAEEWAKAQGFGSYKIVALRHGLSSKYKVVAE